MPPLSTTSKAFNAETNQINFNCIIANGGNTRFSVQAESIVCTTGVTFPYDLLPTHRLGKETNGMAQTIAFHFIIDNFVYSMTE